MELLAYLRKLYAYDDWANREVGRALAAAQPPPARSLRLLAHVVGAEWVWRSRIVPNSKKMAVWPQLTAQEIVREIEELRLAWDSYLGQLTPGRLAETAAYTNSKGEAYRSELSDILTHVVMHSAYHRGQIAADMRAAGLEPAYTDFIHAVRQGRMTVAGVEAKG